MHQHRVQIQLTYDITMVGGELGQLYDQVQKGAHVRRRRAAHAV